MKPFGYRKKYDEWRKNQDIGDDLKNELKAIKGDKDEIRERFKVSWNSGPAVCAELIGAGTMRLNYTPSGGPRRVFPTTSARRAGFAGHSRSL